MNVVFLCSQFRLTPAIMSQRMNIVSNASEVKPNKMINVSEEQQVQIFAKQMLAKRLFIGQYQERRYVDALNSYRDIVCISNTEDDLHRDLNIVKKRIQQVYPSHMIWTGITGPDMIGAPAGCCLWVRLNNLPFGYYWFQIREVIFNESTEICVRLKCLRSISHGEGLPSSSDEVLKEQTVNTDLPQDETSSKPGTDELFAALDIQNIFSFIKDIKYNALLSGMFQALSVLFTLHNAQQVMSFFVILIVAAFTGFFKFVAHLGEFSLKLMREITLFVRVCTPIFLGIIDFFSKCFGGILILITLLWKGSPPNNAFQQNLRPQREFLALPATKGRSQPPPRFPPNRYYSPPYQ